MERVDYGIATLDAALDGATDATPAHAHITDTLGCRETQVDVYRVGSDGVALSTDQERLCVPVDGPGTVVVDDRHAVPSPGFAAVPAGRECRIESETPTSWVVIRAPGDPGEDREPVVIDPGEQAYEVPSTSDIPTAFMTETLGVTGMKVNLRRLAPGQAIPYHTEGRQEELFVPISGPGRMRLARRVHDVPLGSVTRVAPDTPRAAVNSGESDLIWLMVGAPPTGEVDWWDPGATLLDWPGTAIDD